MSGRSLLILALVCAAVVVGAYFYLNRASAADDVAKAAAALKASIPGSGWNGTTPAPASLPVPTVLVNPTGYDNRPLQIGATDAFYGGPVPVQNIVASQTIANNFPADGHSNIYVG